SSDLSRARETGEIIANSLSLPVFSDPGLREAYMGEAQGLLVSEVNAKAKAHPYRTPDGRLGDADVIFAGAESSAQIVERMLRALLRFPQHHTYARIGVAT